MFAEARLIAGACLMAGLVVGCATPGRTQAPERYAKGVVYVLPGIEGKSVWNANIVKGLDAGGVKSAIEIYDWTTGIPGNFVGNLSDLDRNRERARMLARKIVAYREQHPGAPVHLIGHSGGGGVAILTLEALPPGRQIDSAILLAPALSPNYDLTTALRRTRFGVCNFYSEKDVALLKVGTSTFGTIDRARTVSAGAVGFEAPAHLDRLDRQTYARRLRQVEWQPRLRENGASGSHVGWASKDFARDYLAPLVRRNEALRPINTRGLTRR